MDCNTTLDPGNVDISKPVYYLGTQYNNICSFQLIKKYRLNTNYMSSRAICSVLGLGTIYWELMGTNKIRNQKMLILSTGWGTQNKHTKNNWESRKIVLMPSVMELIYIKGRILEWNETILFKSKMLNIFLEWTCTQKSWVSFLTFLPFLNSCGLG